MPKNATHAERLTWRLAHANHCACREPPKSVRAEVELALKKR
jgi:hypothetical protein